jgi:WD40 repeat protein
MNKKLKKYFLILFPVFGLLIGSDLYSQYYYFGRNKVQYTEFKWQIYKTEHFDIYYYPEMQHLAEIGAKFAEQSYELMEVKFNINVNRRIPLIFYSTHLHFEQTNVTPGFIPEGVGGFFEYMKGRVVIPFSGSVSQFRRVIQHEIVHVFMHTKISRVLKDHRLPFERYPPLWFVEGLAEYWSSEWDDQAEMIIRDAVLQDYIVGLDDIDQISGTFVMYKVGQHILSYIAEKYGEEKILLLMENIWKANYFSDVLKTTIGKNYEEFDEKYIYDLKKKYYPLFTNLDQPSAASQEILGEGFNSKPVFYKHNDTSEVIFTGNHTGYTSIYRKDLSKGKKLKLLLQGEKTDEFESFHMFSSKISINKNGILCFTTKSGETDVLHLYNVEQEEIVRTYKFSGLIMISSPSWAADNERIVLSGVDKGGFNDLYIFNTRDESLKRLTNDIYDDRDPVFSPDGKKIVFSSDRSSYQKYNLFLMDLEKNEISYLTFGNENYFAPVYSQDGSKIFFTTTLDGIQNIWAIDMNQIKDSSLTANFEREIRKITNFTTPATDPAITDDDGMVFIAFEKYRFQVRKIDNISQRYDTAKIRYTMDLREIGQPWTINVPAANDDQNVVPYRESYDLDFAVSQVSTDPVFGSSAGAVVALSDMLGNDQYYFLIYNNAQTKSEILESFNIAISRIALMQRTNYAYGIFHFSGRRYDLMDPDEFYWERVFGGYFAFSYPLSVFRRIEASTQISNSDKDTYFKERKALLLSNSVSFISDNSIWCPTGPIDGNRIFLTLAYTTDIKTQNVNYYTVMADYRNYLRLSQGMAFASRFQVYWNEGKEARRFFMGGSWDLRGYNRWSLRGKKLWLTSQELRFPLINSIGVKFPFGGIGFGAIRGALFFDAGSVWDDKYEETLGSFGLGARLNLFGALALRFDTGYLIENNFKKLSKKLFTQFFFGWDF